MSYLEDLKDKIAQAIEDKELFSAALDLIDNTAFPSSDKERLAYVLSKKLQRTEKLLAELRADLARFEEPK